MELERMRQRADELNIPVKNLIHGYVMEELANLMTQTAEGEQLWLENANILGQEQYGKRIENHLYYCFSGKHITRLVLSLLVELQRLATLGVKAFGKEQEELFTVEGMPREGASERGATMELTIRAENMYVPVLITIHPVSGEELYPRLQTIPSVMNDGRQLKFYEMPTEELVVSRIQSIFTYMELINEMEIYLDLYEAITEHPVEGRSVYRKLLELKEQQRLAIDEKKWKLWQEYGDYSYMKRKWKVLLRRQKILSPSWEELQKVLSCFVEPIWTAIAKEEAFFGDWMPELGRFLD
ncbi:MAG: hypothetical protein II571_02530 [Lachnospiraceae bacterium]|nr:hypothetical protein [Lachnospiraceae bacterium]MBQ1720629.1 hypothetical protein [Lachnospiraceae bacterium]MBQ2466334.1 hypothetical protein [Lachnospiraceae bacterium]MBQ2502713.1 hypothetical protein [Lachnospiraceae bacterium]MBQ2578284.1 hypothetical protein [Lachnospiraceae bacterium]